MIVVNAQSLGVCFPPEALSPSFDGNLESTGGLQATRPLTQRLADCKFNQNAIESSGTPRSKAMETHDTARNHVFGTPRHR